MLVQIPSIITKKKLSQKTVPKNGPKNASGKLSQKTELKIYQKMFRIESLNSFKYKTARKAVRKTVPKLFQKTWPIKLILKPVLD